MNENELTDVMTYDEAHYFSNASNEINLGGVITELNESSNPTESEKQYIHEKSKRVNVTGFSNEFSLTMDMVKGDEVFDDLYQIFYQRKTGADAKRDHIIVNLWEPVTESENTYKARKINQTVEITDCEGNPGEQKTIKGSLKGGDFIYGTFNVATKTFTENI